MHNILQIGLDKITVKTSIPYPLHFGRPFVIFSGKDSKVSVLTSKHVECVAAPYSRDAA